jgi:UPF0755 protein
MDIFKKIGILFVAIVVLLFSFHLYVKYESRQVRTLGNTPVPFTVMRGDKTTDIAAHLKAAHIIGNEMIFLYYLLISGQWGGFVAGQYEFSDLMSLRDITRKLRMGEVISQSIRVTFPEGFTAKKMAARLMEKHLPGDAFLKLVQTPTQEIWDTSTALQGVPLGATLEGFLFPDTYEFARDASAEDIVKILMRNFDRRFDDSFRAEMRDGKKNIMEVVTMASLLEAEVRSEADRKIVADIFERRISVGQPLQSCATLQYLLGVDRKQYSIAETKTESPYNTYLHAGLPPGPVDNPGLVSLRAALRPTPNDFWFFLSDAKTGETVFSKDFEEHKRNKSIHGL